MQTAWYTRALAKFLADGEKAFQRPQGKGGAGIRREVAAAARFLPRANALVLDIGANKGLWSQALLAMAGRRIAKIYAFEPSQANEAAIRGLKDERVELIAMGVSDHAGELPLYYDSQGSGLASLSKRRLDHHNVEMGGSEMITLTTVDAFLQERAITHVDFMKMDIEGHELAALKGAAGSLGAGKINALSFEFGGCNIDSRTYFQDFWYFLTPLGYRIARITPYLGLIPIERYNESLECFWNCNYVAYRGF